MSSAEPLRYLAFQRIRRGIPPQLNRPGAVNEMGLYFQNTTGTPVYVAYAYHSPGCDGSEWAKKGWYRIDPGGTAKVLTGWAGPGKYFFFAESEDRTRSWSGPFFTPLPSRAFDWCWNTGSTDSRTLGLAKIEVGWGIQDHTVRLR